LKVYLAGAIEAAPDGGRRWRDDLRPFLENELGFTVHDPTKLEFNVVPPDEYALFREWRETDFTRFQETMHRIIKQDLRTIIFDTDYIICNWDQYVEKGGGTQGELTLAFVYRIPVFMVTQIPVTQISSWILGCATQIFSSYESLKSHLKILENVRKAKLGTA